MVPTISLSLQVRTYVATKFGHNNKDCELCNNSVMTMFLNLIFFLFFFRSSMVVGLENPLVEFYSTEELVQIAGYGTERLSTVLVTGTVLCESRWDDKTRIRPRPVSGASVAFSCHSDGEIRNSNLVPSTTNIYGDFLIDLPSHLHAIPNLEKVCLVRVIQIPKSSPCSPAFSGKNKGLKILTIRKGIRTYTSQTIHLTPKEYHKGANI